MPVKVTTTRVIEVEDHAGDRLEVTAADCGNSSDCLIDVTARGVHLTADEARELAGELLRWAIESENPPD